MPKMNFDNLRELLEPIDVVQASDMFAPDPSPPHPKVREYLDFYGINFARELQGVRHSVGTFTSQDLELVMHYWSPAVPSGTIYVLHGYFDHIGLYKHFFRYALLNNMAIVTFDLPGHGLSAGRRLTVDCFSEYSEALHECFKLTRGRVPEPRHVVGQSTGAAVILNFLADHGRFGLKRIALLAPLIRPKGWYKSKWLYYFLRWAVKKIPRKFSVNSHDQKFLNFLEQKDPLQERFISVPWVGAMAGWINKANKIKTSKEPLLVLQGKGDGTVDWQYNLRLLKKTYPNTKILMLPKARHHLVNESANFRMKVFSTLGKYFGFGKKPSVDYAE